jgi:hypothetical protein
VAFKRAGEDTGPDETVELMALWHKERRSVLKTRQHLLNEAEPLLNELPEELRGSLPDTKAVRPRLAALRQRRGAWPVATALRLRLLEDRRRTILELDRRDILVEVGDPRRFTEGGFARFSGTAPLPRWAPGNPSHGPDPSSDRPMRALRMICRPVPGRFPWCPSAGRNVT